MTKETFQVLERHMQQAMTDSAHDQMHVYRVLYLSLEIAKHEQGVDCDILITASLLHDIGREQQSKDLELDHARIGADMAHALLLSMGWDAQKADAVRECIAAHRYRKGNPPQSLEAKILFDADKLDVCGAIGIARTLIYGGQIVEPLYVLDEDGQLVTEGGGAERSTFLQEYNYKQTKLYDSFFTDHARALAQRRKRAAVSFYQNLISEIDEAHTEGAQALRQILR